MTRSRLSHLFPWLLAALGFAGAALLVRFTAGPGVRASYVTGRVVAIDAGHGGLDPGAVGPNGEREDRIVLQITLDLKEFLESVGIHVALTRSGPEELTGGTDEEERTARIQAVAAANPDVILSIHANSFPSSSLYGAQVFYNPRRHPGGRVLAEDIQRRLQQFTDTDRAANQFIDHFILNHARVPAATVEVGFLSNPREARLLSDRAYQRRVAWAIFLGVVDYLAHAPPERAGGAGGVPPSSRPA